MYFIMKRLLIIGCGDVGLRLIPLLHARKGVYARIYALTRDATQCAALRALGVTSSRRAGIFPDVPTIAEAGYPGYSLDAWGGFFAPAGTPAEIVNKLNREIAAALATPALQNQLSATGAEAIVTSPAEFAAFVWRENEIYGKLVRKLQLKPE